jgi:hypothetical protein
VQALAIAMLPVIVLLRRDRRIASLAAFLFFALVVNAIICGALSNPHDRYQSRLVWLAPLVVAIAAIGWRRHPSIMFRGDSVRGAGTGCGGGIPKRSSVLGGRGHHSRRPIDVGQRAVIVSSQNIQ